MTIRKVKGLDSQFTITPNSTINDSLSWAALGLLTYLCSKPDDWQVSPAQLVKHSERSERPTKRDATYSIINELISKGYMKRVQSNDNGRFGKCDYLVSNVPFTDNPEEHNKPHTDLPYTDGPYPAKPTQQSKDLKQSKERTQSTDRSLSDKSDSVLALDYLNEVCGTKYRASTKSHIQNINARLSEGHSLEDLKAVVDFKYREWNGTQQAQYLRPQTLFQASKFQGYLIAARNSVPRHDVNEISTNFDIPEGWNNV